MAVDAPYGFRWNEHLSGGDPVVRQYIHAAADGAAIGKGDLVDITGAADTVARGAAGGPFTGLSLSYVPASTLWNVDTIFLDERSVLDAQEDSVGGAIAAASEGLNADVVVAAPSATTQLSGMEIDSSTAAGTATLDLRLLEPLAIPGNVVATTNARWRVLVNDLRFGDLKAGA